VKYIKLFIKVTLGIAILYGIGRFSVVYYDSTVIDKRQPYLQQKTSTSIKVKWITPEKEIGRISYKKKSLNADENGLLHVQEKVATRFHSLVIENLKPHTTYEYEVEATSLHVDNTNRYFTTQYENTTDVTETLWVIGDSGQVGKKQQKVYHEAMSYLKNTPIDFWLLLGDNAYRSGTQTQFNEALFDAYAPLVKTNVPWAVNGNHDGRRFAFYDIFDMPKNSESEHYFSIEGANVHIVLLDSYDGDTSKEGKMAQWLEKDLKANQKIWTIVAFHHPPYSKGGHDSDDHWNSGGRMQKMRENIVPILEKHGVDLVLSGHSHAYERSSLIHEHYRDSDYFDGSRNLLSNKKTCYTKSSSKIPYDGAVYLVTGSSSKLDKNNPLNHKAMLVSYEKMGSVILEITNEKLTSKFLSKKGHVIDEFSIHKSKNATCQNSL